MADNRFAQYGPPTTNRFAPPALPYEAPTAAATLAGKNVENVKNTATLPYDITSARNSATSSGIKIKTDQLDYNMKAGIPPGDVRLSGADYLNTLPPGVGDLTREMLAGKYKGAITNSRNPAVMQAALAAAHATHGNFDAAKYDERQSIIQKMTDPNSQLGALNTALAHAGVLYDQAHNVAGTNALGDNLLSNAANSVWNTIYGSSPAVRDYEGTVSKYGPEQAKAYGVGTGGERTGIEQQYSENLPLETKLSLLRNDAHLFAGKVASMAHGYDMVNGNSALDYLSPDARAALQKIDPEGYQKFFGAALPGSVNGNNPPPNGGGGGGNTPSGPPDYSTMTPSDTGFSATPTSGGLKTQYDPRTSALVNSYLRQGISYAGAVDRLKADAPGANLADLTSPSQWNAALAYAKQPGHQNVNLVAATKQVPMSLGEQIGNSVAQSAPGAFAGHYYNNLFLGLPDKLAGKDQSAYFNGISNQQNPWSSFGGDALGMAGAASLAGKGVGAAADAGAELPVLGKYLRGIGVNPAAGLTGEEARAAQTAAAIRRSVTGDQISAGITGANNNPDHPLMGAAANMTAMGAGNVVGRTVVGPSLAWLGDTAPGQAVVNGARSLGAMIKKPFGGAPPVPFNPPPSPDINLSGTTQKALPDITSKLQQAQDAGLPYMVADADPRLRAMLGSATRFSPDVRATAENILQPRQAGQGERAISQINTNLAPVTDVPTAQASILKSAQAQSAPLYGAAKSQPVPELTANPQLNEVLNRPAGQTAIRKGWETALNKGEDVGTLTYATDPQGNPVQYGNPSWNVIHYARQALDQSGDTDVRNALDKQIAALNPGFKQADAAYSTAMKGSDALQAGADATGIRVTPEATQAAMAGFPNNLPHFQQGYASNMADMIERQRLSGNPYNLVNGSLGQQAKLASVFPQGADAFNTAQGLEGDMGKTYQTVLGNSATQGRAMDDKLFSLGDMADTGMDLGAAALTGTNPIGGLIGLAARKGIDAAKFGMNQAKADAIAPFLMNTDPGTNLASISKWIQQNAARKAYLNQAGNLGGQLGVGALGAPAISWASQN